MFETPAAPSDAITSAVVREIQAAEALSDPIEQALALEGVMNLLQERLVPRIAEARREAVAAAVRASGAQAVANQLGLSRARVYAIVDGKGAVKRTRPRADAAELG